MTGSVKKLTPPNLEKVLSHDPKLFDEFIALTSGKQRKYMLAFVNKYNERNTVYMEDGRDAGMTVLSFKL